MRRGAGVAIVFLGLLVVIGAAIYAIIPPIVNEVGSFVSTVPQLITDLQNEPEHPEPGSEIRAAGRAAQLQHRAEPGQRRRRRVADRELHRGVGVPRPADHPGADPVPAGRIPEDQGRGLPVGAGLPPAPGTDLGDRVLKQMGGYLSGATIIAIQAGLVAGIFAASSACPIPGRSGWAPRSWTSSRWSDRSPSGWG